MHASAVTVPGSQFPLKACMVVWIGLYIMQRTVGGSLHSNLYKLYTFTFCIQSLSSDHVVGFVKFG